MKFGFSRDAALLIEKRIYALVRQFRILSEPVRRNTEWGSRYKDFFDFGDAAKYRAHLEEVRRDYHDIKAPRAAETKA